MSALLIHDNHVYWRTDNQLVAAPVHVLRYGRPVPVDWPTLSLDELAVLSSVDEALIVAP